MDHLSQRGRANIEGIMARIPKTILAGTKSTQSTNSLDDSIDLSMAENWLIRDEVLAICKAAIKDNFDTHHLSWPTGFWGDPDLLEVLARFFNTYFHPHTPVESNHITIAPGAAGCLDALFYNVCNAGDGVLVPSPYWNGNDIFFRIRSEVKPIQVTVPNFQESLTTTLVAALETTYASASCPIKALVLANPHNPLGRCYPKAVLEECLKFCNSRGIHLVSDEVFALSTFECPDLPDATPFTSALSLDAAALSCDPSRLHVIWSMSKDFGSSGIKLACTTTQSNDNLRNGLALAAHMNVSTLSAVFATALLSSPTLPSLVALNSTRLGDAYKLLTGFLKSHGIHYFPCNAGPFVLAKLAPTGQSWDEEAAAIEGLQKAGVVVGAGRRYHVHEMGWARVSFAVETAVLKEAMRRMETVFMYSEVV